MNKYSTKLLSGVCLATSMMVSQIAIAQDAFVVRNIEVTGLQRVSKGTVLNYLPIQLGETLHSNETGELIRALYETGFFQSVEIGREGNSLIVHVVERSTIAGIHVTGNKELPNDKLKELLKEMGLVKGRVYQNQVLERLEKELRQAYNARGKYNARVDVDVKTLSDNRVDINITISEGRVATIKEIKIIGNQDFSSSEILKQMSLTTPGLLTYFTKTDQYSKEGLDASLESLRSFYMDRGYIKFQILSSQVLLSPDKKDVFINLHISEGAQYHFSGFDVIGNTILTKNQINDLVRVHKDDTFSRRMVTDSVSELSLALGDKGYGFPLINAEPSIDEKDKSVFMTFVVQPGRHVYVHKINFHGNTRTADYVLMNVMRQSEGSLLTVHNVKESERRLRQLTYLKNIDIKTTPVPGTNNQVDLDVSMDEAPSAEATAALGWGTNGPQFNAGLNQYNFMGTGRSVGFGFNASYWGENYNVNYYNPFYTNTGIGRGFNFYYQHMNPHRLDISAYTSDRFGGDVSYDMTVSEYSRIQGGFGYQDLNIRSVGGVTQIQNFVNEFGKQFRQLRAFGGWNRNTYDQMPYPTRGWNQQLTGKVAVPADSNALKYYQVSYDTRVYQPIYKGFILSLLGNVHYGNTFNNQGLPFFENYYAGGIAVPGTVRGYSSYSLGPQDNFGNSLGGNLMVSGTAGLVLPYPVSQDSFRTSLFVDAGNVYAKNTPAAFTGTAPGPVRYSTGISLEWRSPFGPLSFNLAKPLNKQPGDSTEYFQFTLSSSF